MVRPADAGASKVLVPKVNALFELAREQEGLSTTKLPYAAKAATSESEVAASDFHEDMESASRNSRRKRRGARHRNRGDASPIGADGDEDNADLDDFGSGIDMKEDVVTSQSILSAAEISYGQRNGGSSDASTGVVSSVEEEYTVKAESSQADDEWQAKLVRGKDIIAACPTGDDCRVYERWCRHLESSIEPEEAARRILRMYAALAKQGFIQAGATPAQSPVLGPQPRAYLEDAAEENRSAEFKNFRAAVLAAPAAQKKQLVGERLYNSIARHAPAIAPKITGMMLHSVKDVSEILPLLENEAVLKAKVDEALRALQRSHAPESRQVSKSSDAAAASEEGNTPASNIGGGCSPGGSELGGSSPSQRKKRNKILSQ